MRSLLLAIIIASLLVFPVFAFAQDEAEEGVETEDAELVEGGTGVIKGNIYDTSAKREPVGGVTVSYVGPGLDNRGDVPADATGTFEITGLKPGTYIINATKQGYVDREGLNATAIAGSDSIIEIKMRKRDTPLTYFWKLGPLRWFLLPCSILALTFIIERAYSLYKARAKIGTEQFMAQITESLRNDNIMEAVSICEEAGGPLANVLKAGLLKYSQAMIEERDVTKEEIQEAIQEAGLLEIPQLERNLPVIGTLAVISPLLGLLGTVTGMIKAFTTIALEGTGDPQQLAGGISEALLTTATGLIIAVPCLIFYNLFESLVNNRVLEIEQVSTEMVNSLLLGRTSSSQATE